MTSNWYVAVPVLSDRSDVEGAAVGFQAPAPTDGGPTYSATNLPSGIGVNSTSGWISGTLATGDAANGPYAVVVTTTYADGTSSSQSFNWTVNPVVTTPPVLSNAGSFTGMVGVAVHVDFSAPSSPANPLNYSADDLPDGLYIDPDSGLVFGTPAEDAMENTSVTETVTDSFGNSASQTLDWNVTDSVLTVQGDALSAGEGVGNIFTLATFTDPDLNRQASDYTVSIQWGDGTTTEGWVDGANGSYTVSGDYAYVHPGTDAAQVTITDPSGGSTIMTDTATVSTAALTATGGFSEGEVIGLSPTMTLAVFSDANSYATAGSFTAAIHWCDGASSYGTVDGEDGQFRVLGNHTYAQKGTYTPRPARIDG